MKELEELYLFTEQLEVSKPKDEFTEQEKGFNIAISKVQLEILKRLGHRPKTTKTAS